MPKRTIFISSVQREFLNERRLLADYIRDELGGVIGAGYEDPYGEGRITAVE